MDRLKPKQNRENWTERQRPHTAIKARPLLFATCEKAARAAKQRYGIAEILSICQILSESLGERIRRADLLEAMVLNPNIQGLVASGPRAARNYLRYRNAFLVLFEQHAPITYRKIAMQVIEEEYKRANYMSVNTATNYFSKYPDVAEMFGIHPSPETKTEPSE